MRILNKKELRELILCKGIEKHVHFLFSEDMKNINWSFPFQKYILKIDTDYFKKDCNNLKEINSRITEVFKEIELKMTKIAEKSIIDRLATNDNVEIVDKSSPYYGKTGIIVDIKSIPIEMINFKGKQLSSKEETFIIVKMDGIVEKFRTDQIKKMD